MASSTDFTLLFKKYQEDGIKQGISIVKYCQMNGVVYSHFERWYKKCRAGVVLPVEIVDAGGHVTHFQFDFKYLVALLKCPVISKPPSRYLKWNVKII